MRRILAGIVGVVGTLALLAGLHHIVVVTTKGTAFSAAFAPTCSWCHGGAYAGWGEEQQSSLEPFPRRPHS
mgnify:CR=1 FL=1